ncbi:dihydrolipoamide acetyltransferase family protein [Desulfogranum mediterraneum]|uniref:dihydrolipoamide acetyltransferase family protein n=1 Tax=Desulfogranum mediterraneum TaxID=160661 RepID=UPI0006851E6B|nr:dihydrolipoamide acetyltransferase family protein [Desulfogranum mediterraneum]
MSTTSFFMPDLGEGIHEAEVLSILVELGQEVKEGQTILEMETDKAAVEIPSPVTGVVTEIAVQAGAMVAVGQVLLVFTTDDRAGVPAEQNRSTAPGPEPEPAGEGAGSKPSPGRGKIVPASPASRRLARELGIELQLVPPSGAAGLVTADDIRAFAAQEAARTVPPSSGEQASGETAPPGGMVPEAAAPVPSTSAGEPLRECFPEGQVERLPFRSIRRATAARMTRSWTEIPHVTCQDSVDISALEAFRQRHREEIAQAGGKLTMTVFALKAVATALKNYPHFNASLDLDAGEIIVKHYFHLGVATDTEHGLMVPVIRDVDRKSIRELAIELHELLARARLRKVAREELQGGTFTITNAGAMGGGFFSPIINYPETAILGLGQARLQPAVVTDDQGEQGIEPRLIMPIMLCFDHRVVDGADAIRFLQVVIDGLNDPDKLLMTMI